MHTSLPLLERGSTPLLRIGGGVLLGIVVLMATVNLESTPAFWWDEGWTLSVARTWVEQGHYGCLINGEPTSQRLAGALTVIAPIAVSFQLFGVGIWQGRIVIVGFALGALLLWYWLTRCLAGRPIAIGALGVLFLTASHPTLHPLLIGRQVLGEVPALFYLLGGYACLLRALRDSVWRSDPDGLGNVGDVGDVRWIAVAAVCWGLALSTKLQVIPFWLVSLLIPCGLVMHQRRWRFAGLLGTGLLGAGVVYVCIRLVKQAYLTTIPSEMVSGLSSVTALVTIPWVRWKALSLALSLGLPTLLGLAYATAQWFRNAEYAKLASAEEVLRSVLLSLAGSWFAWYILFSNGWPRYLFPPLFVGSLFVAILLSELSDGFRFSRVMTRLVYAARPPQQGVLRAVGALLIIVLIGASGVKTGKMLYYTFAWGADDSAVRVAQFLNVHTPADALVETYDSPLFFLLERRYHYPPDRVSVELVRTMFLQQAPHVDYDPLEQDPDYLVVKQPFMMWWTLYEPAIQAGEFRLIQRYGRYKIYERVRSEQTDTGAEEHLLTPTDSRHHSVRLGLAGTRALPDKELEKSRQAVIY